MKRKHIAHRWLACGALMTVVAACTSAGPEPVVGAALSGDSATLPELEVQEWAAIAAGCEGMIDGNERFALAQPDGLVVAVRTEGAVCVDTLPAVEEELAALGVEDQADALARGYWATIDARALSRSKSGSTNPTAGEPNPQPSLETGAPIRTHAAITPTAGEPNPQPSGPAGGEPNPQPSGESTNDGSKGTDGTEDGSAPPMVPLI